MDPRGCGWEVADTGQVQLWTEHHGAGFFLPLFSGCLVGVHGALSSCPSPRRRREEEKREFCCVERKPVGWWLWWPWGTALVTSPPSYGKATPRREENEPIDIRGTRRALSRTTSFPVTTPVTRNHFQLLF